MGFVFVNCYAVANAQSGGAGGYIFWYQSGSFTNWVFGKRDTQVGYLRIMIGNCQAGEYLVFTHWHMTTMSLTLNE